MANDVKGGSKMNADEMGLKQHDLKVSTVVFMVFSLVAAGCYGIESMIPSSGPGLTLILLMVLPFVWGLPFGLVASELGSVRPQEGGYYKWVQEALGEFWGFQAGWWRTISIYIDNTLYVILAGSYLGAVWDIGFWGEFAFKAAMVLFFMWINLRGVKDVGIVTSLISIFVIAAFAMVAIVGFANYQTNPFEPIFAYAPEGGTDYFFLLAGGLSIGMWMYSGYESMSTIAGELKNPQVIPKATLITVPLIMATYILPTSGALSALPGLWGKWGEEGSKVGYHTVPWEYLGAGAGMFFLIVAVVAQFSIYNTYIASGSRGFFALAEDNLAPPIMVKVSKKKGVPYIAVISVSIVNLILCNFAFSTVVVVDVFLLVASYVLVYISCMILRKRLPASEYEGKFKIPGGMGFLRLLCIVPICVAFFSFMINGTDYFIGGMIGIVTGPILYFIWRKMYGGLTKKDPVLHPKNDRTGLAIGDSFRMALMFLILGTIGIIGRVFLPWYEGVGGWIFPKDYDMTLFGSQEAMWSAILIASVICFGIAAIMYFLGKAVEPKKQK